MSFQNKISKNKWYIFMKNYEKEKMATVNDKTLHLGKQSFRSLPPFYKKKKK